jgi:hypothetical protein
MSEPVITEAELKEEMARLDALRPTGPGPLMTDEQMRLIEHARSGERPVKWRVIVEWWAEKYGERLQETTLHHRYDKTIARRGRK